MLRKTVLHVERLEQRLVLDGQTDFLINTSLAGDQLNPALAADAQGNYVAVWEGLNLANNTKDIYARQFHADGTPSSPELLVNGLTAGDQRFPKVAVDAAGDFVVVWRGPNPANGKLDLYGRRFDATGLPLTGDVLLNPGTENLDSGVQAAINPAGDQVVVTRTGRVTGEPDIYAQRYDGNLNATGTVFLVNANRVGPQSTSRVVMDGTGNIVVSWNTLSSSGLNAVRGRRFDAHDQPLTGDLSVGADVSDRVNNALALAPDGGFLAVWVSPNFTTNKREAVALRFDANNQPGSPFTASDPATNTNGAAAGFDAGGDSVIVWEGAAGSPAVESVHALRYDPLGNPAGPAEQLNVLPSANPDAVAAAVAVAPDGAYLAAWVYQDASHFADVHASFRPSPHQPPVLNSLTGTTTGNEGDTFAFHASATDPSGATLTYSWDLNGDGVFGDAQGPDVQAVLTKAGTANVSVQVANARGETALGVLAVTVQNVAPIANPGPDQTIDEGGSISFQGTSSDPGAASETYLYDWDFNYNGQTFNPQAFGPDTQQTFLQPGTHQVALRVLDGHGGTGIGVATVTVRAVAPTADAGLDQTVMEGSSVSLHGGVSDPNLSLHTYTYSWLVTQDGLPVAAATTQDFSFTPGSSGIYLATFTVTNERGNSGSDSATLTVLDAPLVAEPVAVTATEGADTGLVPVATFADTGIPQPTGSYTAVIDWGDGTSSPGTIVATAGRFSVIGSHTYGEEGAYPVLVTISDMGGSSTTAASTLNVADGIPAVAVTVGQGPSPLQVTITAGYSDTVAESHYALITWGDGTSSTIALGSGATGFFTATHKYNHKPSEEHTDQVTVIVQDDEGTASQPAVFLVNFRPHADAEFLPVCGGNSTGQTTSSSPGQRHETHDPAPAPQLPQGKDGEDRHSKEDERSLGQQACDALFGALGKDLAALFLNVFDR